MGAAAGHYAAVVLAAALLLALLSGAARGHTSMCQTERDLLRAFEEDSVTVAEVDASAITLGDAWTGVDMLAPIRLRRNFTVRAAQSRQLPLLDFAFFSRKVVVEKGYTLTIGPNLMVARIRWTAPAVGLDLVAPSEGRVVLTHLTYYLLTCAPIPAIGPSLRHMVKGSEGDDLIEPLPGPWCHPLRPRACWAAAFWTPGEQVYHINIVKERAEGPDYLATVVNSTGICETVITDLTCVKAKGMRVCTEEGRLRWLTKTSKGISGRLANIYQLPAEPTGVVEAALKLAATAVLLVLGISIIRRHTHDGKANAAHTRGGRAPGPRLPPSGSVSHSSASMCSAASSLGGASNSASLATASPSSRAGSGDVGSRGSPSQAGSARSRLAAGSGAASSAGDSAGPSKRLAPVQTAHEAGAEGSSSQLPPAGKQAGGWGQAGGSPEGPGAGEGSAQAAPQQQQQGSPGPEPGSKGALHAWLDDSNPLASVHRLADYLGTIPVTSKGGAGGAAEGSAAQVLTIGAEIGRGSWGRVYMGSWKGLAVAVKTLTFSAAPPASSGQGEQAGEPAKWRERALREAAVAVSCSHPNVVTTYSVDLKPRTTVTTYGGGSSSTTIVKQEQPGEEMELFLVQELCGLNLGDAAAARLLQTRNGSIDRASVLQLLLDVARGIQYLHARGIVHGDLKPQNVLLKREASRAPFPAIAKIIDFGLSCVMDPCQTHISNHKLGTAFYVAPEVVLGGCISTASDMFSFGVMAWELLSGLPPYERSKAGADKPQGTGMWVVNQAFHASLQQELAKGRMGGRLGSTGVLLHGCLRDNPKARPPIGSLVQQLSDLLHVELTAAVELSGVAWQAHIPT